MKRTIGSCCYVAVYAAGKSEEAARGCNAAGAAGCVRPAYSRSAPSTRHSVQRPALVVMAAMRRTADGVSLADPIRPAVLKFEYPGASRRAASPSAEPPRGPVLHDPQIAIMAVTSPRKSRVTSAALRIQAPDTGKGRATNRWSTAQLTPSANPWCYSKRSLRALCASSSRLVSRSIVSNTRLLQLATALAFSGPSASVN